MESATLQCKNCGTTQTPRFLKGMCYACYQRAAYREKHPNLRTVAPKDHRSLEPEYVSWRGMIGRCKYDKRYMAKEIHVCERWLGPKGYENFLEDMGRKPGYEKSTTKSGSKAQWTIDRIDNNGDYTPENCRWANKAQQSMNRSISNNCPGVAVAGNGWTAYISKGGKRKSRHFMELEDAVAWRKGMELILYGKEL